MIKGIRKAALVAIAVLIFALVISYPSVTITAYAKSYDFDLVDIKATIQPNGDLVVTESRTLDFNGSFSSFWYDIPLEDTNGISGITVYDSGKQMQRSSSQSSGTYSYTQSGNKATFKLYFNASNEKRTFTFDYTYKNVVTAHKDVAELYWTAIGPGWDVPTNHARIEVLYPSGVSVNDDIRVWAHGPLYGVVSKTDNPSMLLTIDNLRPNTFVECRTTFPVDSVPSATRRSADTALPSIVKQETGWAESSNKIRDEYRSNYNTTSTIDPPSKIEQILIDYDPYFAALSLLIGLSLILWVHFSYNREFKPGFDGDYYRELPGEYSPAILGVLWHFGSPGPNDFTAEIMNLARTGYLKITEERSEHKRVFGLFGTATDYDYRIEKTDKYRQKNDLADYQESLMSIIFLTGQESVTFDEIAKYAKGHPSDFQRRYRLWQSKVKAYAERFEFFDASIIKGKIIGALTGLAMIGLGVLALINISSFTIPAFAIVLTILGAVLFIFSLAMNRRSSTGSTDMRKWQAFRKFLLDFSSLDTAMIPSMKIWEHYLVYAISLGVAKEVIKQLPLVFPELRDDPTRFGHGWLLIGSMHSFDHLNSITDSINSSIATAIAASPKSSGSGAGGGFSGGGGGGFGGGGGGAN